MTLVYRDSCFRKSVTYRCDLPRSVILIHEVYSGQIKCNELGNKFTTYTAKKKK